MSSIHVNYLLLCYCPSNRDTSLDQRQTDRQTTRRCWSIYHPNLAAIQFISISDFSLSFILLLRLSTLSRLTQSRQWQFNVSFKSLQLRHPSRNKVYFNPPADFPLWRGDSLVACFVANPLWIFWASAVELPRLIRSFELLLDTRLTNLIKTTACGGVRAAVVVFVLEWKFISVHAIRWMALKK